MRKRFSTALAAVILVALAGCVGIPTSGGVNDGVLIDDQDAPDFLVLPKDPVPGSDQQQILDDFMQAVSSPQNGYQVAKKFLTSDFALIWDPDASAIVRSDAVSEESTGDTTMTYSFTSRAQVNELGNFQELEPSSQSLTFEFAQENGEWRISKAANGIVLSQSGFDTAFREQVLYFFDPSYAYLVPDVRWFPARQTSSTRVVTALLGGPSPWLQQAVTTAFPDATALGSGVTTEPGSVVVDLSTEALSSTALVRDRMRQQLVATLEKPNVEMTVGGLELTTPAASGNRAEANPGVDPAVLVGAGGTAFGFDGGTGIASIKGLTDQVVAGGAVAAALAADKQSVAFTTVDGAVYVALAGDSEATLIDPAPGHTAPSIDPFRFVWSAVASDASSLTAWEVDATPHPIPGLPADSTIESLDVSRDGARLLLLLSTPVGPRLVVTGIVRQENVPIGLTELVDLPISSDTPIDATWLDNRNVAAITADAEGRTSVTGFEIGGPSFSLGPVQGALTIAGGNGGVDGLRVLATAGDIWRPRGSQGWVSTGIEASFLATKQ